MKKHLVEQIREDHGLFGSPIRDAELPVEMVFGSLPKALERYGRITVPGFGTFTRKFVDTRQVRNPRTGEKSTQLAHHVTKFREAKR